VEKHEAKGRTTVSVRKLSEGERVGELARMMAGKEITDLARAHAREMLKK
jgi:DNA repair protein RecN (Recombination protein N)